jgi:hypothetical protein
VVWVAGEADHHLTVEACGLVLFGILTQRVEIARSIDGAGVEFAAVLFGYAWHIAIGAFVPAAAIGICGKCRVLASLPTRRVNVAAAFDGHAVGIDLDHGCLALSKLKSVLRLCQQTAVFTTLFVTFGASIFCYGWKEKGERTGQNRPPASSD